MRNVSKDLTPVQMADVIRSCGYIMQVRDWIGEDGGTTTYVCAMSLRAKSDIRRLGMIEMIARQEKKMLRRRIKEVFGSRGESESL